MYTHRFNMTWQMATSLYLLAAAHCSQRTVAQPECRLPENESDTNDMGGADGGRRRKGDELVGLRLPVDLDAWRLIHVIMTPFSTPVACQCCHLPQTSHCNAVGFPNRVEIKSLHVAHNKS